MMQSIRKIMPKQSARTKRVRKQRRAQVKTLIGDISSIASKEIERTQELLTELLSEETDNPIVLEENEEDDKNQESISM